MNKEEKEKKYKLACIDYLIALYDAYDKKEYPPSASWSLICDVYKISPLEFYSPKAGYLKCPICGISRPYALKPLNQESICNEWYLHPNKELYKFNLKDGWERNPEYEKPSKNYIPKMSLEDIKNITCYNKKSSKKKD